MGFVKGQKLYRKSAKMENNIIYWGDPLLGGSEDVRFEG